MGHLHHAVKRLFTRRRLELGLGVLIPLILAACGSGGETEFGGTIASSATGAASGGATSMATSAPDLSIKLSAADAGPPIYRFAKISSGAYFFTGDENEKNVIITTYADFRYEGSTFGKSTGVGSTPVYRFANLTGNGAYFYTTNPSERDATIANYPTIYRYEGSSFSVEAGPSSASQLTYRLANLRNGAYLYTINPAERVAATATGVWRDEGVAFSSRPTTLAECLLVATGTVRYYIKCKDLTKVPWAIGVYSGNSSASGVGFVSGTCTASINAVGDISMTLYGKTLTTRLDASTLDDSIMLDSSDGSSDIFAENPLDGSEVHVQSDSQGIAFFYRVKTSDATSTYQCDTTSKSAIKRADPDDSTTLTPRNGIRPSIEKSLRPALDRHGRTS